MSAVSRERKTHNSHHGGEPGPGGRSVGFPRTSRLLKHSSFESVYKTGKRHFSPLLTVFFVMRPAIEAQTAGARVGFTVGRVLGGSVVRNRIRRRVRDAVRHYLAELNQALAEKKLAAEVVINPKKQSLDADYVRLREEVRKAFAVVAMAAQSFS